MIYKFAVVSLQFVAQGRATSSPTLLFNTERDALPTYSNYKLQTANSKLL